MVDITSHKEPIKMLFGQYKGNSVEQVAIQDYKYFNWLLKNDEIEIKNDLLEERIKYVHHVANNFTPEKNCKIEECENPAYNIAIIKNPYRNERTSSPNLTYCSRKHFIQDTKKHHGKHKPTLHPTKFDSALSKTKHDTNKLVEIIADCMGLKGMLNKKGRKTKKYLTEFFNNCHLQKKYRPDKAQLDLF